jgi:hypothetical protein
LNNVLHIPAAWSNLISGIQLDRAGVVSTLGNKLISLSINGKVVLQGAIINDMYRLHVFIVPPKTIPLLNRISSPPPTLPLISRIEASNRSLIERIEAPTVSPNSGTDFYTA